MKTVWISPIFVLLRFHNSLMKFILNRCNLSFYTLIKLHTSHFHLYYIHSIFFKFSARFQNKLLCFQLSYSVCARYIRNMYFLETHIFKCFKDLYF